MNPRFASGSFSRFAVISITTSSGTSLPAAMYFWACCPSFVFFATFRRRMSPVEMCGTFSRSASLTACVPLPAPGGPSMMMRIGEDIRSAGKKRSRPATRQKRGSPASRAGPPTVHRIVSIPSSRMRASTSAPRSGNVFT